MVRVEAVAQVVSYLSYLSYPSYKHRGDLVRVEAVAQVVRVRVGARQRVVDEGYLYEVGREEGRNGRNGRNGRYGKYGRYGREDVLTGQGRELQRRAATPRQEGMQVRSP